MIVVKVELHSAITGKVTRLGKMVIGNDGTGTGRIGNYDAWVLRKADAENHITRTTLDAATRKGRVENYARQSYVIWRLVLRALRACYPEEK